MCVFIEFIPDFSFDYAVVHLIPINFFTRLNRKNFSRNNLFIFISIFTSSTHCIAFSCFFSVFFSFYASQIVTHSISVSLWYSAHLTIHRFSTETEKRNIIFLLLCSNTNDKTSSTSWTKSTVLSVNSVLFFYSIFFFSTFVCLVRCRFQSTKRRHNELDDWVKVVFRRVTKMREKSKCNLCEWTSTWNWDIVAICCLCIVS